MSRRARPGDAPIPTTGRIVGVDLGDVRTGVAVTDPGQVLASALRTLPIGDPDDDEELVGALAGVVAEQGAVGVVVGLPRTLDGREAGAARRARRVVEALAEAAGVPVDVWDERFSTVEAERVMVEQGVRRADRRRAVDKVAATVILQNYLEARRLGGV